MSELFEVSGVEAPPVRPTQVSKAGLAGLMGLAKSRIIQLIADGLPVEPNGMIDVDRAFTWYDANVDPDRRKRMREEDGRWSPSDELKRLKIEQAHLDLEKARGSLVDRRSAEAAIFARARAERDAHLGWAARVAPVLAQRLGIDPTTLFKQLDRELREHLAKLAETSLAELGHGT